MANKSSPYAAEFKMLKEKKRKTLETLKVTENLCLEIGPKMSKLTASQLKAETMQMLIKSCEKLCEFFETHLKISECIAHRSQYNHGPDDSQSKRSFNFCSVLFRTHQIASL